MNSKDGTGALFKNDKGDNQNRPDYRGDITIDGVTYELAAWIRPMKSDASKRFMSLSARPKQDRQPPAQKPPQRRQRDDDMDDDIPF